MADEWMLVPTREGCVLVNDTDALGDDVLNWYRLRSVPPIPRPVWDAMVERAFERLGPSTWCSEVDAALRAALNNPRVEGDKP